MWGRILVLDTVMDIREALFSWLRRQIRVTIQEIFDFLGNAFFGRRSLESYNTRVSRKATLGELL